MSSILYRVGECMQELIKIWKEYESSQAEKVGDSSQTGPTLEIRIPAEHVSATNRQVLEHLASFLFSLEHFCDELSHTQTHMTHLEIIPFYVYIHKLSCLVLIKGKMIQAWIIMAV